MAKAKGGYMEYHIVKERRYLVRAGNEELYELEATIKSAIRALLLQREQQFNMERGHTPHLECISYITLEIYEPKF